MVSESEQGIDEASTVSQASLRPLGRRERMQAHALGHAESVRVFPNRDRVNIF